MTGRAINGWAEARSELLRLNAEYQELTGERFYLYAERPHGTTRFAFTDGIITGGYAAAAVHMARALDAEKRRRAQA